LRSWIRKNSEGGQTRRLKKAFFRSLTTSATSEKNKSNVDYALVWLGNFDAVQIKKRSRRLAACFLWNDWKV